MIYKFIIFTFFTLFSIACFGQKTTVRHLVLFKLKSGITKDDSRVIDGLKMMKGMTSKIKEIKELECGSNFSERPVAVDIGLYTSFESKEDLSIYLKHPEHLELVKYWKELADWTIADFETL